MRIDESAKLFFDATVKKALKYNFVNAPVLSRKRKQPNYRTIEQHFQVEGHHESGEAHHPATPEDYYQSIYFEAIDILNSSIKSRFDQPSFQVFFKLERYLLQAINESSKTWLRSTMKSKRFNALSIIHIHKEFTDKLDEFVSLHENRQVWKFR